MCTQTIYRVSKLHKVCEIAIYLYEASTKLIADQLYEQGLFKQIHRWTTDLSVPSSNLVRRGYYIPLPHFSHFHCHTIS